MSNSAHGIRSRHLRLVRLAAVLVGFSLVMTACAVIPPVKDDASTTPKKTEVTVQVLYAKGDTGGHSSQTISVNPLSDGDFSIDISENEVSGFGDMIRAASWNAVMVATVLTGASLSNQYCFELGGWVDGPSVGGLTTAAVLSLFLGDDMIDGGYAKLKVAADAELAGYQEAAADFRALSTEVQEVAFAIYQDAADSADRARNLQNQGLQGGAFTEALNANSLMRATTEAYTTAQLALRQGPAALAAKLSAAKTAEDKFTAFLDQLGTYTPKTLSDVESRDGVRERLRGLFTAHLRGEHPRHPAGQRGQRRLPQYRFAARRRDDPSCCSNSPAPRSMRRRPSSRSVATMAAPRSRKTSTLTPSDHSSAAAPTRTGPRSRPACSRGQRRTGASRPRCSATRSWISTSP